MSSKPKTTSSILPFLSGTCHSTSVAPRETSLTTSPLELVIVNALTGSAVCRFAEIAHFHLRLHVRGEAEQDQSRRCHAK